MLTADSHALISQNPGGFIRVMAESPPRVVIISEFRAGWIWPKGVVALDRSLIVMGSKEGKITIVEGDDDDFNHSYRVIPGNPTGKHIP